MVPLRAVILRAADKRCGLSVPVGLLLPADANFKDVYGKSVFLPEIQLGMQVSGPVYAWVRYGFFSKSGTIPDSTDTAKTTQGMLSFGAGVVIPVTAKLNLALQAGGLSHHFKEEALDQIYSATKFGFCADAMLGMQLGSGMYTGIQLGYRTASDTVDSRDLTLGGISTGVTVGVTF
jgi:hypothetical protein